MVRIAKNRKHHIKPHKARKMVKMGKDTNQSQNTHHACSQTLITLIMEHPFDDAWAKMLCKYIRGDL